MLVSAKIHAQSLKLHLLLAPLFYIGSTGFYLFSGYIYETNFSWLAQEMTSGERGTIVNQNMKKTSGFQC